MAENQASNAAADVEMSQYVADRTRVNEDKIKQDDEIIEQFGDYNYGWHDTDFAGEAAKKGIDENVVRAISADKHEPEWMLEKRLEGYRDFIDRPMPQWGVDLKDFDADDFKYYVKPIDKQATTWEELPDEIRSTYDKLGIPERRKADSSPASPRSTSPRSSTIQSRRISKSRASSLSTPTPPCKSTRNSSRSISANAFRATTTNSRH